MASARQRFYHATDALKEALLIAWLWLPRLSRSRKKTYEPEIIVALTSYPGRIRQAWLAIETILRQSLLPGRVILVLAVTQFPDHTLPWSIRRQLNRGLEILWVERDGKSFDKLIPLKILYPQATIITCDDDKYFPRTLLHSLVRAHQENPDRVIGGRGWVIHPSKDSAGIAYGNNWVRANPGEFGTNLLMPGGNMVLYPASALDPGVIDLDRALQLTPTADDLWFWAHVQKRGAIFECLGLPPYRAIRMVSPSSSLSAVNEESNNPQFQAVMDALDIRHHVESHAG